MPSQSDFKGDFSLWAPAGEGEALAFESDSDVGIPTAWCGLKLRQGHGKALRLLRAWRAERLRDIKLIELIPIIPRWGRAPVIGGGSFEFKF